MFLNNLSEIFVSNIVMQVKNDFILNLFWLESDYVSTQVLTYCIITNFCVS